MFKEVTEKFNKIIRFLLIGIIEQISPRGDVTEHQKGFHAVVSNKLDVSVNSVTDHQATFSFHAFQLISESLQREISGQVLVGLPNRGGFNRSDQSSGTHEHVTGAGQQP